MRATEKACQLHHTEMFMFFVTTHSLLLSVEFLQEPASFSSMMIFYVILKICIQGTKYHFKEMLQPLMEKWTSVLH